MRKHRTLMIVLALTSALLLAGSAAVAKKPGKGKGKKAGGEAAKVKRFLSSPEVAKAFRLPKSVKLSPQQRRCQTSNATVLKLVLVKGSLGRLNVVSLHGYGVRTEAQRWLVILRFRSEKFYTD